MWAILAAPMMVSADISTLPPTTLRALTSREAVAIDQDPLGLQGRPVARRGSLQVWVKPLADHRKAVAILNRGTRTGRVRMTGAMIGLSRRRLTVRNVWTHSTTSARRTTVSVAGHSAGPLLVRNASNANQKMKRGS